MLTAYLGPAGSWTHQAALDLFGDAGLVPLARDELFSAYAAGTVERVCVPVITSIVGVTPYMDAVLELPEVTVIAEYPRMLSYSLLAWPGTRQHEITEVFAHPVAFVEAKDIARRANRCLPFAKDCKGGWSPGKCRLRRASQRSWSPYRAGGDRHDTVRRCGGGAWGFRHADAASA